MILVSDMARLYSATHGAWLQGFWHISLDTL